MIHDSHLQQTVHVAGGSLVLETNITCVFLGVPTHAMWSISIHLHLEYDRVILDVSLLRVQHLRPAHVVREAPVILLGVEVVGDVPGEGCPVPLVDHPEVS